MTAWRGVQLFSSPSPEKTSCVVFRPVRVVAPCASVVSPWTTVQPKALSGRRTADNPVCVRVTLPKS